MIAGEDCPGAFVDSWAHRHCLYRGQNDPEHHRSPVMTASAIFVVATFCTTRAPAHGASDASECDRW
jgi:hypothetical protein